MKPKTYTLTTANIVNAAQAINCATADNSEAMTALSRIIPKKADACGTVEVDLYDWEARAIGLNAPA
jgi:hypothetical protein